MNDLAELVDNNMIKKAVALRAKYKSKQHPLRTKIHCMNIVPHMVCWDGEALPVARTQALAGVILENGYDQSEANSHGIVVDYGGPKWGQWDRAELFAHYMANTGKDPRHAAMHEDGIYPAFASLSKSTLNVLNRNILCGKPGCECTRPTPLSSVVAEFKCICKARRILSATGCYSMIRLLGQCGGFDILVLRLHAASRASERVL